MTQREALPRTTSDLEQAYTDLDEHGACIIADALPPALLSEIRTATYRAAENDRRFVWGEQYQYGNDHGINQRVWNLPSRDPVFCHLAELPFEKSGGRRCFPAWPPTSPGAAVRA